MFTFFCVTLACHEQIRGRRRLPADKQIEMKIDKLSKRLADTKYNPSELKNIIPEIEEQLDAILDTSTDFNDETESKLDTLEDQLVKATNFLDLYARGVCVPVYVKRKYK